MSISWIHTKITPSIYSTLTVLTVFGVSVYFVGKIGAIECSYVTCSIIDYRLENFLLPVAVQ